MTRRILDAIDEYVYVGELLPGDGYQLLFQGPCRGQFLGLDPVAAQSVVWADYVHPDDLAEFDAIHARASATGVLDGQYRVVGADGVTRWVRDRGRVETEDGRSLLYGSVLDVTEIHIVQDELERAREEADRLGRLDPLTGAANRRALPDLLDRRLAREQDGLGVLLLDLDRFKLVNDAYGHAVGDEVLVETARRIRATVRETDAVARIGGEEFLVLLGGVTDRETLRRVGEAIRHQLRASPIVAGDLSLPVTISVGAAISGPGLGEPSALLAAADRALYAAKHNGRDRVCLDGDELALDEGEQESTELRLARALAATVAAREGVDGGHGERVAELAARVAVELRASPDVVSRCRLGGLVHDVGKVGVPDAILLKPGPLDVAEWAVMRRHPEIGERLVGAVPDLDDLGAVIRHHHERWDGSGYPDRLMAEQIPLEARIVGAVDAYSAMTTDRVYRAALPGEQPLAELARCAGTQFDPAVVQALVAVVARVKD